MTIDKAIEILVETIRSPFYLGRLDTKEAIQLGIVSLREIQKLRKSSLWGEHQPLPGEDPQSELRPR
jgi:hypothetical protein